MVHDYFQNIVLSVAVIALIHTAAVVVVCVPKIIRTLRSIEHMISVRIEFDRINHQIGSTPRGSKVNNPVTQHDPVSNENDIIQYPKTMFGNQDSPEQGPLR